MDNRQIDLSKYRIQEAEDSLRVAEHCLKEGLYKKSDYDDFYIASMNQAGLNQPGFFYVTNYSAGAIFLF